MRSTRIRTILAAVTLAAATLDVTAAWVAGSASLGEPVRDARKAAAQGAGRSSRAAALAGIETWLQQAAQAGRPLQRLELRIRRTGEIVERVTGESYADAVRRLLLEPVGTTRTAFLLVDDVPPNAARGYVPGAGGTWMCEPGPVPPPGADAARTAPFATYCASIANSITAAS